MFTEKNTEFSAFLRAAGWRETGGLWRSREGKRFHVVEERAPGSWDRSAAPFLAKAVLAARASAPRDAESVAALWVKRASALTDARLTAFMAEVAPEQSWLLHDSDGHFFAHVRAAPELGRARVEPTRTGRQAPLLARTSLFTDVNQWLLKVLLAPHLKEGHLRAPRRPLRNATMLADAADVSVPTATRFLRALDDEGQLEAGFGDLRVARPLELLRAWRDRAGRSAKREVGAVFPRLGGGDPAVMLFAATVVAAGRSPRFALASHAACKRLGLGHVEGAVPAAWIETLQSDALERLGLVLDDSAAPHLLLRVPRFPRSTFRAAVGDASDVIQCWLDTSHERVRGAEQADYLLRTVLKPAFS